MSNKIYPIGIQNFEKIRNDGYFYIDKTALMYQMVKTGSYYFLSRPRRFGKSLLISTLEAYFQGKKELFEGLAVEKLEKDQGLFIYNLGTGIGYSVLDVVKAFEKANGVDIPYEIKPRRDGDIATCYCDPSKAKRELGWQATRSLEEMCEDSWRWQSQNPNGYEA